MFFVRPPHPRENNDLEFVGEGRTTSPLRYSIDGLLDHAGGGLLDLSELETQRSYIYSRTT